jgi:sulfur-oxidizing protein SoxY
MLMNPQRRELLRLGSALGLALSAGLLTPTQVFGATWNKPAFDAKSVADVLKALGAEQAANAAQVAIIAPDIAENGAVVPVSVSSTASGTETIVILVDKNPNTLSAVFSILPDTEPAISTRIKMNGTSNVLALVKADGKWMMASKEIKVTLGGCGG